MKTSHLYDNFLGRKPLDDEFEIVKSEGFHIYDSQGKKYIDFLMGWCVGNFGWGNPEIKNAIAAMDAPSYVYPNFLYRPWGELAQLLASIAPGKLKKCFRTTGGTEAVDAAMQIAMCCTNRHKFMSLEGSYHGNSLAAISLGSISHRKTYKNLLTNCTKVKPPLDQAQLKKIEARLKRQDIAAFIMEPIVCNMGVLIPSQDFMSGLQNLCKKYGTLLIMDEVATGFGRTGKLFASEHFGIEPDIMTLAKAITGGFASLGAVITTDEIAEAVNQKIGSGSSLLYTFLYSTYGWHPASVNAAIASLNYVIKNKSALLQNVTRMSDLFERRLKSMPFKISPLINMKGLAICVNTTDADYAKGIKMRCRASGLLLDAEGSYLMMFPALTLDEKTADDGLTILEKSL